MNSSGVLARKGQYGTYMLVKDICCVHENVDIKEIRKHFSQDCTCVTGIFDVRFMHLTSHDLFRHHNVKMLQIQTTSSESLKRVELLNNYMKQSQVHILLSMQYYYCETTHVRHMSTYWKVTSHSLDSNGNLFGIFDQVFTYKFLKWVIQFIIFGPSKCAFSKWRGDLRHKFKRFTTQ